MLVAILQNHLLQQHSWEGKGKEEARWSEGQKKRSGARKRNVHVEEHGNKRGGKDGKAGKGKGEEVGGFAVLCVSEHLLVLPCGCV